MERDKTASARTQEEEYMEMEKRRKPEIETVAIVGLGALGILFGKYLSDRMPEKNLRIVADRERIDRYRTQKVYCNGELCDFHYVEPGEQPGPADLIIFTVKYQNLREAIEAVSNQVGENTIILSALNGISSEELIGQAFGMEKVVYCVAQGMDGIREGSNLNYEHMGMLCFGNRDAGVVSEKVERVAEFFRKTNFPHEVETDMTRRLWGKFMLNVGVNQTAALYSCCYGGLQKEGEARTTMIDAMKEVLVLSQAEGVPLKEEDLNYWLDVLSRLHPDGKPSMQQDMDAGRPTEVELFSGTVLALASKHGIDCPVNRKLYDEIRDKERNHN